MAAQAFSTREEAHLHSRGCMRSGDFHIAVEILLQSYLDFGPHILQLVDISSCYYMLKDYSNYRTWTLMAWNEFDKVNDQLSESSFLSGCLALGKLLEELGNISAALEIYERGSRYTVMNRFGVKIRAQLLRVYCWLGNIPKISESYLTLNMAPKEDLSCTFDAQHAFVHADCHLKGHKAAYRRVRNFLTLDTPCFEKRLIFFDFAYEILKAEVDSSFLLQDLELFRYQDCDPFEQVIWDFILLDCGKEPIDFIDIDRTEGLSPLCTLRILTLMHAKNATLGIESEFSMRRIALLMQDLNKASRKMITQSLVIEEGNVEVRISEGTLIFGDQKVDLKGQPVTLTLISSFLEKNEVPSEDLIRKLYQLPYDELTYGRLRTLVSRSNSLLTNLTGIKSPISVSKNTIRLKRQIRIGKNE